MKHLRILLSILAITGISSSAATGPVQLLQRPTLSKTHIVFSYAGDLWKVPRDGGEAIRLTNGIGLETDPVFSPDGALVAFTGEYDGNYDIYVVPAAGGVPKRLTYHPGQDRAVGWTPDGNRILFRSGRTSYSRFEKLFTVAREGGLAVEIPLAMAQGGSYSPDGTRIAYNPFGPNRPFNSLDAWKRYRGGRASPIWIASLADSSMVKLPRDTSNDFEPMWIGNRIFFLSDRNGPVSLFVYDTAGKSITQAISNGGMDIKSASAGPGGIVYDQFGALFLFDTGTGKTRRVNVNLTGDLPEVRPKFINVAKELRTARISPTGARAVFEAHGEILTVPADKGDIRNITNSAGVMDRDPAWSPDGKRIAWLSDESGEYMLHIKPQNGTGEPQKIALTPAFYYSPVWSPDNKKIALTDNRLNLWNIDLDSGKQSKVDTDTYYDPQHFLDPAWSPDSRWIAYTRQLKNHLRAVFLFSTQTGKSRQITDGMSDARYAAFDPEGKYLYFTASTNAGPTSGWLDMSSDPHTVTRSIYLAVLQKDTPSPLQPESDEEKAMEPAAKEKAAESKAPPVPEVKVDFDEMQQRILPLPIPARDYSKLSAGKAGVIFIAERDGQAGPLATQTLHKFDLKTRKLTKVLDGISGFDLAYNGEKVLVKQAARYLIASTSQPDKPGEGVLKTEGMEVKSDPPEEWKQMYREVWRIQRDFFYDPGYHGLDLKRAQKMYEPYLEGVSARSDLNYLFQDMLGELTVGHLYIRGGAVPQARPVAGGLLGADYELANGRYRFARVYGGENWNPNTRAPLTQPGVNVKAGEYLLAVNGLELKGADDIYSYFEGTAGKSVLLKVSSDAAGANAREVTVVPMDSEVGLRNLAWVEGNRRKVDQMTGGRVAYVYMPDTGAGGYTSFNRYFFSQVDKDAVIVDERFNGGGQAADYVIDALRRPFLNYWSTRYGEDTRTPVGAIFGPKAMIINEFAGSGGDAMPWYFRKTGLGPLVGKRTWGGLVGILGFPILMDGGTITAPNLAFWSPKGEWDVENHGVAPDVEVELDPKAVREGRDPQLETAVALVLEGLRKNPPPSHKKPAYPNYHPPAVTKRAGGAAGAQ